MNLVLKPLGRRRRPDRVAHDVLEARHVPMPESTSFPSGHSASAFAFATGVAHVLPAAGHVADDLPHRLHAAAVGAAEDGGEAEGADDGGEQLPVGVAAHQRGHVRAGELRER